MFFPGGFRFALFFYRAQPGKSTDPGDSGAGRFTRLGGAFYPGKKILLLVSVQSVLNNN